MVRNIVAVFAGLIAAMATFVIIEQIGHAMYPPPAGLNFEDKAAVKTFMDTRPLGAYLLVLFGWVVGSAEAGFLAQRISKAGTKTLPAILSAVLTASGAVNFYLLPHPLWFVVLGLVSFAPLVFTGWFLSKRLAA